MPVYGFNDLDVATSLRDLGQRRIQSSTEDSGPNPQVTPQHFTNDFRHRTYIAIVEVVSTISAAYWDSEAGPNGRWVAGRGKVKVYQKYPEPVDNPLPEDRLNNVGVWKKTHKNNPGTTTKPEMPDVQTRDEYVIECYNKTCFAYESTDQDTIPRLYLAWEDIHGTLWIEPDETTTHPKPFPVEATDCILPGQGSTTVIPYVYDGTNWIPDGTRTCTIHDPTCILFAVPGDIFWVHPVPGGATDPCFPSGGGVCEANVQAPFGTTRRVRIEQQLDCEATGTATILGPDPNNSMGQCKEVKWDFDPDEEATKFCTIQVCNKTGRKIMCFAVQGDGLQYEDGVATLDPSTCTWYFKADERAMKARVLLTQQLCHNTADVTIDPAVEFKDVCNWAGRETISKVFNPMKRQACENKFAIVEFDAVLCRWEVETVEPHITDIVSETSACQDSGCTGLKQKRYEGVGIETCVCEPIESEVAQADTIPLITGMFFQTGGTPGQPDEVCELWATINPICVIGCNMPGAQPYPAKLMDTTKIQYLKDIDEGVSAIECTPGSAFVLGCAETTGSPTPCITLEDCPEPNDPIEKP